MKLPDFLIDDDMNRLRRAMGAELVPFKAEAGWQPLTPFEIERLASEGIEIPIEDVQVLNDGTHVYKGRRVIVYIRDQEEYAGAISFPKYHLAMCDTLSRMMLAGRYKKRYVVASREDGLFKINRIRNGKVAESGDKKLDVCQHCLQELSYKGYSGTLSKQARAKTVSSFSLREFFDEYGRSCVWAAPTYDSTHAPINVYSPNFFRVAKSIKEYRGFRCEEPKCKIDLSALEHRRFLHAHHLDGDKSDNDPANIRLLCIRCHSKQFGHSHMKGNPDLQRFAELFAQ